MLKAGCTTLIYLLTLTLFTSCGGSNTPIDATPVGEPNNSDIIAALEALNGGNAPPSTGITDNNSSNSNIDFQGQYVAGQAELIWQDTEVENLTAFNIRRSMTPITDFRAGIEIYRGRDFQFTDTQVPLAEAVYYRLFFEIRDSDMVASESTSVRTLTLVDDSPPSAIGNLSLTESGSHISFRWVNPADVDFNGVEVFRELSAFSSTSGLTPFSHVSAANDLFIDYSVTSGETYFYGFVPVDSLAQRGPLTTYDLAFIDSQPPLPPRQLEAQISEDSVQLTWAPSLSDDVDHYLIASSNLFYPSVDDALASLSSIETDQLFFNDQGLSQIDYFYSVFAVDANDNVSTVESISARPSSLSRPPSPSSFTAVPGGTDKAVDLNWADASTDADSFVLAHSKVSHWYTLDDVPAELRVDIADNTATSYVFTASDNQLSYFSLFSITGGIASPPAQANSLPRDVTPPPGALTLSATEDDIGVLLNWSLPNDADITDVIIHWDTGAAPSDLGDGFRLTKLPKTSEQIYHFSAQPSTTYYYSIFSSDTFENINLAEVQSASITTSGDSNVERLSNVRVTPSDGQATLEWQALTDTSLTIFYHVSTNPNYLTDNPGATPIQLLGSRTSETILSLTNQQQHHIWVSTYDSIALVESEKVQLQVTPRDDVPPPQLQNVTATGEENLIRLAWNEDNLIGASFIKIRMSESTAPENSGQGLAIYDQVPGRNPVFSATNLEENTRYFFSFFTVDSNGNESLPISISETTRDITAPNKPNNVNLRPGNGIIELYWDLPNPSDDVFQTKLIRSETPIVDHTSGNPIYLPADQRFYSDTQVVDDTLYYYGIYFIDSASNISTGSLLNGETTDVIPPATVTNVVATPTDGAINISWVNPLDADFNKTIIGYVEGSFPANSPAALTNSNEVIAPGNMTDFTSLTNDQTYTFSVFALDTNGNYEGFGQVTAIPSSSDPAPQALSFTAVAGENQITLNWTNPGANIDETFIKRSAISFADATASGTTVSGSSFTPAAITFTDTLLSNGTSYFYVLTNRNGNGDSTELQASATPADATAPATITGLTVSEIDTQIDFTWTNPSDPDLQEIVIVRRGDDFPTGPADGTVIPNTFTAAGALQTASDTGLTNGVIYYYAFFARDAAGIYSEKVSTGASPQDLTPPSPVTSLTVTAQEGRVYLDWVNPVDLDLDRIVIRRSTSLPAPATFDVGDSVASLDNGGAGPVPNDFFDSNVTVGTTYYYSVFSVDDKNNASTGVSNGVAAIPTDLTPPAVPTFLTAVDGQDNQITLNWTEPTEPDYSAMVVCRKSGAVPINDTDCDSRTVVIESGTATNSHVETLLATATTYTFYLYSSDDSNNLSPPLSVSGVTDFAPIPGGSIEQAYAQNGSIFLDLSYQSFSGHFNYYTIVQNLGAYVALDPTDGTAFHNSSSTSVNRTGLTNLSEYTFTLFAFEDDGEWVAGDNVTLQPLTAGNVEHLYLSNMGAAGSLEPTVSYLDTSRFLIISHDQASEDTIETASLTLDSGALSTDSDSITLPDEQRINDFSSVYGLGVGYRYDDANSQSDLSLWSMNTTGTVSSSNVHYTNNGLEEVAISSVYDSNGHVTSGFSGTPADIFPSLWRTLSTSLKTDFETGGQWDLNTVFDLASTQAAFVDHIVMSDGTHYLAVDDVALGAEHSLWALSLTSTNVISFAGFNGGNVWLTEQPTVFAYDGTDASAEAYPIYLATTDSATFSATIWAFNNDGTANSFNGSTELVLTAAGFTNIEITSMLKDGSKLHVLATGFNGVDHDVIYWRITTTGTVELESIFNSNDLDGDLVADAPLDLYAGAVHKHSTSGQLFFTATGLNGGIYEIISGRISND
jgi:hypothetical protein